MYHGYEKPHEANDFLKMFIEEAVNILNSGLPFKDSLFTVKIRAFTCDVPAKAFIKYTSHNGYNSCSKCKIEGIYQDNRVCFPELQSLARNDIEFRSKLDESHHIGTSILENLPGIDMINSFPLDYMLLICLGVVKKLIVNLWVHNRKTKGKLPYKAINESQNQGKITL